MKRVLLISIFGTILSLSALAQFEETKLKGEDFEKLKVRLGADFAMQYQVLNHHADTTLIPQIGRAHV